MEDKQFLSMGATVELNCRRQAARKIRDAIGIVGPFRVRAVWPKKEGHLLVGLARIEEDSGNGHDPEWLRHNKEDNTWKVQSHVPNGGTTNDSMTPAFVEASLLKPARIPKGKCIKLPI